MNLNNYRLEEIKVGMEFSLEKRIDEDKIRQFAELTGDFHPLHTDTQYAIDNGFKGIMAHGLLISSFSSTLIGMQIPGENAIIMSQSFKYINPAYINDQIQIKATVAEVDERFSTITVKIKIVNTESLNIASGKYIVKIRS